MAFEQVMLRTASGQEYGPASMDTMALWRREGRVPPDAMLLDVATGEARPVAEFPMLVIPPPPMPGAARSAQPGAVPSGFDSVNPPQNPNALAALWCGVCGLIPCFTPFLGPIAFILGLLGFRDFGRLNVGKAYAITGIVLGLLETLATIFFVVLLIIGMATS